MQANTMAPTTTRATQADGTTVRVELVWLDPSLASHYLERYRYDQQRTVSASHIEFLTYEMRAGRFAVEAIYIVHHEGKAYLTDGQHRCHAVIASGAALLVPVVHIYVTEADQIARDYIRRDCGRGRTIAQSYSATGLSQNVNLSDTKINALGAACTILISGFTNSMVSPLHKSRDVRRAAIEDWAPTAHAYFDAIAGAEGTLHRALSRAAVMAVALVTFRYQPVDAVKFWKRVAQNEGLVKGDPERVLVQYLIRFAAISRARSEYARAVAVAWNAAYEARDLQLIRVTDQALETPIHIAGTPYNGKDLVTVTYE